MAADISGASLARDPALPAEAEAVRAFLLENADWLRGDPHLLGALALRPDAANVVDFGPVALSRVTAAHQWESGERRRLEAMAQANFAAQTQTHAAVLDVLEADSLEDLASRVDALARQRFGLVVGALAMEGPDQAPGWLSLLEGQTNLLMGPDPMARLGHIPTAAGLFGDHAPAIQSVAVARLIFPDSDRQGVMAFGALDAEAFTEDMGDELVVFLARVVERVARRWPTI